VTLANDQKTSETGGAAGAVDGIDARFFRNVLGKYPTGVCIITAQGEGSPVGMVVGSFTSVSLDPPLVAFLPDKRSTSWGEIRSRGHFCVNILADCHGDLCRKMTGPAGQRFDDVDYHLSPGRAPILESALAWIDCSIFAVHEAGDHFIVIGEVQAMNTHREGKPLLFFEGGYGAFLPLAKS